jgi:hypothetical protein
MAKARGPPYLLVTESSPILSCVPASLTRGGAHFFRVRPMTQLTNISEEASLVLVTELIATLERERLSNGQPSLVAQLKAAIAKAWAKNPAAPGMRVGLADAQLVLEWVEQGQAEPEAAADLHAGDLTDAAR